MRLINKGVLPVYLRPGDRIIVACAGRGEQQDFGYVATVDSVAVAEPGVWRVEFSYESEGYGTLSGYRTYGGQDEVDTIVVEVPAK